MNFVDLLMIGVLLAGMPALYIAGFFTYNGVIPHLCKALFVFVTGMAVIGLLA